jgi:hypothetical protein
MTRPRLVALFAAIALAAPALSFGEEGGAPSATAMDELRVPASPAFVLMGVSPSSVERPSTPRALALSVLSASERSDTRLVQDLAVEFAPYWWESHPNLTFDAYYDADKGIGPTILQTLAISIGTTDLEDQAAAEGTRAGVGIRFMLRHGDAPPGLGEAVAALREAQDALNENLPDDPEIEVDQELVARFDEKISEAGRAVAALDKQRVGWVVEFAGALVGDFPGDDAGDAEVGRVGAWLTASYHGGERLTFLGVCRYILDDRGSATVDEKDLGARLIWKGDEDAGVPAALSVEYVRRFVSGDDDTDKLVAVLEYRLPFEGISLVASYGKTFESDFTGREDLISTLGVNFGFGRGPVVRARPESIE